MKEVIRVERKRALNLKNFLILSLVVLLMSIFSSISSLKNYDVYDLSGKIIISSKDNLKESKLNKYKTVLNEDTLKGVVNREDKSKYLYNSNLIRFLIINYTDKKIDQITYDDISEFYNKRILNLKNNLDMNPIEFTDTQVSYLLSKGEKLKQPLQIGYAEGWKNLNNDMINFVPFILVIISVIMLPIFAQDPKTNMKQLYTATKYGKKTLIKARVIAGFEVGIIIYIVSMLIFSISKLITFGIGGHNLFIQNSANYFLSTYNITYLQQYLLNISIGFIAMLLMVAIVLFFTVLVEQILSGAVLLVFFWIVMSILPPSFSISHYITNFLPYNMTNFNNYYISNEVYNILGNTIPSAIWVMTISFISFIILVIITIVISNIKLRKKLK